MSTVRTVTTYYNTVTRSWCNAVGTWLPESQHPFLTVYENYVLMLLSFVDSVGQAVDYFEDCDSFGVVIKSSVESTGVTLVIATNDDINVSGDWSAADKDEGKFSIRLNGATAELLAALVDKEKQSFWFEFTGKLDGEPLVRFSTKLLCYNSLGDPGTISALPSVHYGTVEVENGNDFALIPTVVFTNKTFNVTLEAPSGAIENVAVANVLPGVTGATVYLTSPVSLAGYKIHYIVYG